MKANVFIISMLTDIVVTYAMLLLGCAFTGRTLPTVGVVILSLIGKHPVKDVCQITVNTAMIVST